MEPSNVVVTPRSSTQYYTLLLCTRWHVGTGEVGEGVRSIGARDWLVTFLIGKAESSMAGRRRAPVTGGGGNSKVGLLLHVTSLNPRQDPCHSILRTVDVLHAERTDSFCYVPTYLTL